MGTQAERIIITEGSRHERHTLAAYIEAGLLVPNVLEDRGSLISYDGECEAWRCDVLGFALFGKYEGDVELACAAFEMMVDSGLGFELPIAQNLGLSFLLVEQVSRLHDKGDHTVASVIDLLRAG